MSAIFELDAKSRQDVGRGASRRLRREDLVPAIVYGASEQPVNITLLHKTIARALQDEAFYSHILTIKLDKKSQQVVLKDVQRHPFKKRILHVDFLRVKANEELEMSVPLHFINADNAPGVKAGGGVPLYYMNEIAITCLPANLPEFIEVDLGNVELDKVIHLTDLKLPAKVNLATAIEEDEDNLPVATIHLPRVVEEPEEVEGPVETEILTEKKEGEDDAAPGDAKPEAKKE